MFSFDSYFPVDEREIMTEQGLCYSVNGPITALLQSKYFIDFRILLIVPLLPSSDLKKREEDGALDIDILSDWSMCFKSNSFP